VHGEGHDGRDHPGGAHGVDARRGARRARDAGYQHREHEQADEPELPRGLDVEGVRVAGVLRQSAAREPLLPEAPGADSVQRVRGERVESDPPVRVAVVRERDESL